MPRARKGQGFLSADIEGFDRVEGSRSGWLESSCEEIARQRSDRRFT